MAVAPDNTNNVAGATVTTLTTTAFVITSSANRAALLGLIMNFDTSSNFTSTCGGVSGAVVTGSDAGTVTGNGRTLIHGVVNPASGSQTASMSWTTAQTSSLGVITASAVDQTTTFNGGTFANGNSTTPAVTVTSPAGDMSFDCNWVANLVSAPTQTQVWIDSVQTGGGGSRKTTISNTNATHSWTQATGIWCDSGANMIAAAVTGWGHLIGLKNNRLVGIS